MARAVPLLLCCCVALLALPGSAAAAYTVEPWADCGAGFNSGSYDDAGTLYVPCGNPSTVRAFGADGLEKTSVGLSFFVSDVAPSPDGAYLYVTSSDIAPRRLNRQADGTYVLDPNWAMQQYSLYGAKTPHGAFLDTDSAGNIYLADGAWSPNNTHTVVKYDPAGNVITRFGEYTFYPANDPRSWDLDYFYWMLTGVLAVGDGSVVYTLEGGNDRVQKWTRQGNGSYKASTSYGGSPATDPNREGACSNGQAFAGTFAAPYDLGSDLAGNFYVVNTTCHEVIKFDSSWNYLLDVDVGSETSPSDAWPDGSLKRPHGIAVAANGNVCIGQSHAQMREAGTPLPCAPKAVVPPPPDPGPDPNPEPAPGPGPAPRDVTPPVVTIQAAKSQRLGTKRRLRLSVSCDEPCSFSLAARVAYGKRSVRLKTAKGTAAPGRPAQQRYTLSRALAKRIVRALKRHSAARLRVFVKATDAPLNAAAPVAAVVRIRR